MNGAAASPHQPQSADTSVPFRFLRLSRWAFAPDRPTGGCSSLPRTCARILLIMYAEYFRTHLAIRASALTFAILLSLIPMLALSTSILKGLGNDEQVRQAAIRFVDQLEAPILPAHPREGMTTPAGEPAVPSDPGRSVGPSATAHLHRIIDLIFEYVDRTNFAALGAFGVLGLIVVILLVLSSIEEAMNVIWHTRRGRSFFRKIMDYMALLILLPLSLNVALAAEAIVANQRIMEHLSLILPATWMLAVLLKLVPFVGMVITLVTMYLFFPHTRVNTSAALAGALFAGIFWFIVQKMYIVLQVGVANYNAIYGSFASVPLFLIWLQLGWTFILLGASLAYAIQHHRHYLPSPHSLVSPQQQLQVAFDILRIVYANFACRTSTSLETLCAHLPRNRHPEIEGVAALLVAGNLLASAETDQELTFTPVAPAEQLPADEVVRLVLGDAQLPSPGGRLAARTVGAAAQSLAGMCLATTFAPAILQPTQTMDSPAHAAHSTAHRLPD